MNTDTVCIFPDTIPEAEILFPLVQVFEPIVYLRPVENDPPAGADLSPFCREAAEPGLIRFACPAPLAEDRDRFLQLVRDLQERRDDYAGQLSNLSLAGIGRGGKAETKTSIIGTLLKQTGIRKGQDEQQIMVLWQARLVLKLAEIFDREQKELHNSLKRISKRENGLLHELREEDNQPFSLTRSLNSGAGKTDGQLRQRLKAWSRLFSLGSEQPAASIFITTSRDASDLLLEQYTLKQKIQPQPLLELQLPGGHETDTAAEQRTVFQKDAAELIGTLHELLQHPGEVDEQKHAALNGRHCKWADLLEHHYPARENSRCTLTLYSLPAIDPGNLFLETFGRDEDEVRKKTEDTPETLVIGLLEEQAES
jgi:hypothetical protein